MKDELNMIKLEKRVKAENNKYDINKENNIKMAEMWGGGRKDNEQNEEREKRT